mgnify:CR=1 FL=1
MNKITSTSCTPDSLVEKIKVYNQNYRAGHPDISDQEYDDLVQRLKEVDPDNSWFQSIEPAVVVSEGRKRKLPIPMKSLNKVKCIAEVEKWIASLGLPPKTEIVCMPKFDGLSLLVNEQTGMAYSRGGSDNEGQDCSKHIMAANIAKNTSFHFTYGEFIISNAEWDAYFKDQISPSTGDKFKSPRNTAAGMLNSDDPSDLIQYASLFRYGVGEADNFQFITFWDQIDALCECYNQPKLFSKHIVGELNEEFLRKLFVEWSNMYPIDGIVIYINDLNIWDKVGRHQSSGNPLYAVAYKHPDFTTVFKTVVKSITWNVSKSGALKPVVNIETVDTGDCDMENPTGYNAAFISDMKIAKGAEIFVTRSGGVIPKILSTISSAPLEEQNKMWDDLSMCPVCDSPTAWNNTFVELCCTNQDCAGRRQAKIIHFFTTCGAENMGEESYAKLFNAGFNSVKKILNITPKEILSIDGFGESAVEIILSNNEKIKEGVEAPVLMHASDCFVGIGQKKSQQILKDMGDFVDTFYSLKYHPIANEEDSKTYKSFCDGVLSFYNFIKENGLIIKAMQKKYIKSDGKCSGMKVCFTGVRDKGLESLIISEGGEIVSGVSKKTTHLIVADLSSSSSKMAKAKGLGVVINTINMFRENCCF